MRLVVDEAARKRFITRYWRQGMRALTASQQPVMAMILDYDTGDLKRRIPNLLSKEPMLQYVAAIWEKTGSTFALDTNKKLLAAKSVASDLSTKKGQVEDLFWIDRFTRYGRQRSQKIIGSLMDTQTQAMNDVIDRVVIEAGAQGLSIPNTRKLIQEGLTKEMGVINRYQAERIARTEVIGASNKGSFDAAKETGLVTSKFWSTSGLPNTRQSHLDYEAMGDVEMDYEYAPGLQYPGDPEGDPDEIINCRCTHILNVD
jgi:hypothetical protein